jgi:molybdopterin synthase catalytic subunit
VFAIVREPIALRALEDVVRSGDGGVVRFQGIVRGYSEDGTTVTHLWYEAFDAMAVREFQAITAESRERFGDVAMAIVHRIGEVPAGDISVAVLAAAPHRRAAFDACRYAIDELKRRAPIWKKEHYAGGAASWRANDSA